MAFVAGVVEMLTDPRSKASRPRVGIVAAAAAIVTAPRATISSVMNAAFSSRRGSRPSVTSGLS
jgi:hypothetical protein